MKLFSFLKKSLGFLFIFTSFLIFSPFRCTSPTPNLPPNAITGKEIRAIWVQAGAASTPEKADAMIARIIQGDFNTLIYCIGSGNVAYKSELLDWLPFVTLEYDPLTYVVDQAHAAGLEVQAWWCPGLIMTYGTLRERYPEWDVSVVEGVPDDFHWANFSLPEVRHFIGDIAVEIVELYDVDGVHLDYIRYPSPPAQADCCQFFSSDDISDTVQEVYQRVKAADPTVQVTAAVRARPEDAINAQQDWVRWLEEDYIDNVMPMAYLGSDAREMRKLQRLLAEWQTLPHFERVIPGLAVSYSSDGLTNPKTPEQIFAQIDLCQENVVSGFSIFDEDTITDEILSSLASEF